MSIKGAHNKNVYIFLMTNVEVIGHYVSLILGITEAYLLTMLSNSGEVLCASDVQSV